MAMNTVTGERDQLKSAKIAVLKLINEHKEILFGKVSDVLTREVKEAKWDEVAEQAHTLGAFPWHRSWDYLKDTTWQNWRKRFVEKREKREKFGPAKIKYDEADLIIMEILDGLGVKNNASQNYYVSHPGTIRDIADVLEIEFDIKNELHEDDGTDGTNHLQVESQLDMNGDHDTSHMFSSVTDSQDFKFNGQDLKNGYDDIRTNYQSHAQAHSNINQDQSNYMTNGDGGTEISSSRSDGAQPKIISTSSLSSPTSRASALKRSAYASLRSGGGVHGGRKRPAVQLNGGSVERELADLKCKKIRAELELLQRESYKKDLEILQLERSLGLPASPITKKFYRRT